jgi:choline dehydrogenase
MAVVAADPRVHGLDRLRVCDVSIMTRINSSDINSPTIMIGEKGSNLIHSRARLPSVNLPAYAGSPPARRLRGTKIAIYTMAEGPRD